VNKGKNPQDKKLQSDNIKQHIPIEENITIDKNIKQNQTLNS
jgi:hypothetical protein